MATKYDNWKTSAPDMNSEEWTEAVEDVTSDMSIGDQEEMVQVIAASSSALDWIAGAIEIPQHHLTAFRDLIAMADSYREQVEDAMKVFHDPRD